MDFGREVTNNKIARLHMDNKTQDRLVLETKEAIEYANTYFFDVINTPILYHNSTIEALFAGILVKDPESEDKAISLFATDHRYLNDDNEIKHGCTLLRAKVKNLFGLDFCNDNEIFADNSSAFVISFSKEKDCLPMWSTYGNKGDGIAFGFDAVLLKQSLNRIVPCLYSDKDINKFLYMALENLKDYNNERITKEEITERAYRLGYLTSSMIPQLKNSYYAYENEIRYVNYSVTDIKYRYRNNIIIPFVIKYLPRKTLKSIIIGPNLDFETSKQSIQEYINSLGFVDVEIIPSKAPYRNL